MATIPYALSITHFVNSVGAKAGFASIIGLALLILLFFTQSRETATLRRRADEAEQQLYQLQLYVDHLSRARSQPAAAPAPAAAQTTSAPVAAPPAAALAARSAASRTIPGERTEGGGVATLPAAPAGVGAPALSSATRLIPLTESDEISIRALRPSTNGGSHDEGPANGTVVTPPPGPPPSTAAGGGNGLARPPAAVPMPTMGTPAAQPAPPPRVALPRQPRPAAPAPAPRRSGRNRSGRRINPVFFVLAGILAAAVVAVVLIFVTGSSHGTSSSNTSSSAASASNPAAGKAAKTGTRRRTTSGTVTPSAVTVAVLNGTTTNNLAADVLNKLTAAGYKGGAKQNAAENGVSSTIVGYTAPTYRSDALAVAKSLNLGPASVQAVSQGDRVKVCASSATCTTQVVVTAGTDLAQNG
jgi:hypothetical protein